MISLGYALIELRQFDAARSILEAARDQARLRCAFTRAERIAAQANEYISVCYREVGRLDDALMTAREGFAGHQALRGGRITITSSLKVIDTLHLLRRHAEALALARQQWQLIRKQFPLDDPLTRTFGGCIVHLVETSPDGASPDDLRLAQEIERLFRA